MHVTEFTERIEAQYGAYRPGMRETVEYRLRGASWSNLDKLFDAVSDDYEGHNPPSWSRIRKVAFGAGLALGGADVDYESVCESCGAQYDIDAQNCPRCGEGRVFGVVTRVKKDVGGGVYE